MSFSLHHRFIVQPKTLDVVKSHCEPSETFVWVGAKRSARPQKLRRWFLRGVPGNQIDMALLEGWDGDSQMAVEIGRKSGRYDDRQRWQIVVRHWFAGGRQPLPSGHIIVSPDEDDNTAAIAAGWKPVPGSTVVGEDGEARPAQPGSWMEVFARLRVELDDYDPRAILLWHWRGYYSQPIPHSEVDSIIAEFIALLPANATLASANRLASRLLYAAAHARGWRKLTLRDQERFHLSGQWHPEETIIRRRADLGFPSGCGEYTERAAEGDDHHYVRTAHGIVDIE